MKLLQVQFIILVNIFFVSCQPEKHSNLAENVEQKVILNQMPKYEIQNSVEISVPTSLELRNENSEIAKKMNEFRDNYNQETNYHKIGKSDLVFQPKGTNERNKDAIDDATRITVAYFKNDNNTFPRWNEDLSSQISESLNDMFKNLTVKTLEEMPMQTELLNWNPIKTGMINEQSYFNTSYDYLMNGSKTYSDSYQFFNTNEKVIVTITGDISTKEKWDKTFNEIVNSFIFKSKK